MIDLEQIQAKDVHIAVLNKQFKTTNYESVGFLLWEENEVVQAIKHPTLGLWVCLKLEENVEGTNIRDFHDRLIVSWSHLDFIDVKWNKVR